MELIRDVLDKQIHDEKGCKIGKVDGIVIALRQGRPPRIMALELGVVTLARRIHRSLGDRVAQMERRWGLTGSDPVRIGFEHVVETGVDVRVGIEATRTGALKWEDWLKDHVVSRIPGAQR
jgi:sporulation protein YlmC with PRC-barrel domain